MDINAAPQPGTVVLGYDGSSHAEEAARWAADEATLENRVLSIVHVAAPPSGYEISAFAAAGMPPDRVRAAIRAEAGRLVRSLGARLQANMPELEVELVVATGDPREVLVDHSASASTLFVGSRGRGPVKTLLLGSVGVAVCRSAHCPTFVIRPSHPARHHSGVLVGTDGTNVSQQTLEVAFRQASLRRMPLTVLYSVGSMSPELHPGVIYDETRYPEIRTDVAASIADLVAKFPEVPVKLRLAHGAPDSTLVLLSELMDLVVVGHHAGPAPGDLVRLGSFAPAVVESAACPVLVVAGSDGGSSLR